MVDGFSALAQWAAVVAIAVGLIFTWRRNGKSSAEREGAFNNEVEHVGKKLDGMDVGIEEIKKNQGKQEVQCALISTQLIARVEHLERSHYESPKEG